MPPQQLCGKFGVCCEQYTSVLRAELRALAEVLRIACGPLKIYVDNAQVVDGVRLGRAWCEDAKREGADIWREVWCMLSEMDGIEVLKVKAHRKFVHVLEGRIEFRHWCGNGAADLGAKAGCDAAARSSPGEWPQTCWRKAQEWYRWVTTVAADWINDTAMSGPVSKPVPKRLGKSEGSKQESRNPTRRHEIWRNSKRAWCRSCGKTSGWPEGGPTPAVFRTSCRGTMADRCGVKPPGIVFDPGAYDDGAVTLSFLHGQFAVRYREEEEESNGAGMLPTTEAVSPVAKNSSPRGHEPSLRIEEFLEDLPLDDLAGNSAQADQVHHSHRLRRNANAVWCAVCGRSAISRIGVGLQRPCRGAAEGAYPARIARMKAGRHPVTGVQLTNFR